ncbi:MAG: rRNA maturation RNase YbeY [Rhodospirillaceae bacterium]|jgi:probable rRNA maturation factor|nr:rRNA maturation RNase YbeY [Rhodospirillaceae bacterium]MBT4045021.1 rRNA maturation RNase YbeY [Rhodospirillaceae bacterium]MBT4687611.1 rRNA maturation RNase YbeY [Rhodospirillaceae bacterium]MBT5082029.1 rRNA maturation RNase YbeY [Rhodospirillaceae bacterium]MBT5524763.1 rRNA maturation RNase YbeY [Rhodospirillaceae bacterium]
MQTATQIETIVSTPCPAWLTDLPEAVATTQRVVEMVLGAADLARPEIEVGVTLTDDGSVRELNRDYRQQDKATNVLSFIGDNDDDPAHPGPLLLGDIVLAHGVVATEAQAQGKSMHDHYCHLLVHGTLHLLGYDHVDEAEAITMEAREVAILAAMGIEDPYQNSGLHAVAD